MNTIGKMLVIVNVGLSVLMLCWGLALYFHPIDWGHKEAQKLYSEPPKEKAGDKLPNMRQAAVIDKVGAALQQDIDARPRGEARLEAAQRNRNSVQEIFAKNHLEYVKKVEILEKSEEPVAVHELKYDDKNGTLVLDPPGMTVLDRNGKPELDKEKPVVDESKRIGFPEFQKDPVPNLTKSYAAYAADLKKVMEDFKTVSDRITKLLEQEKKLTIRVNGVREGGKFTVPGYYDLLELETTAQRQLNEEIDYLQPLWARELVNAQLLLARSQALQRRIQELKGKKVVAN